jgi:hypothetical protein
MQITTVGLDLAKDVIQVHDANTHKLLYRTSSRLPTWESAAV